MCNLFCLEISCTGQEFDAELGLYNYRARFYDPRLGRFYATDPNTVRLTTKQPMEQAQR